MANKYIVQHRRGTTKDWTDTGLSLNEGEIGIEYNDETQTQARLLIGTKDGRNALPFAAVSKIRTITLHKDNWEGTMSPWTQVFEKGTIDGVTENSKIDLQPTTELLAYLVDEEITLLAENNGGTVTVVALNWKPDIDITIQATIVEIAE